MSTDVREIEQVVTERQYKEPGDDEKFSHYVPKHQLTQAMIEGTPCRALCGKMWVPTRDADKFPVCPECKEKWEAMEWSTS